MPRPTLQELLMPILQPIMEADIVTMSYEDWERIRINQVVGAFQLPSVMRGQAVIIQIEEAK